MPYGRGASGGAFLPVPSFCRLDVLDISDFIKQRLVGFGRISVSACEADCLWIALRTKIVTYCLDLISLLLRDLWEPCEGDLRGERPTGVTYRKGPYFTLFQPLLGTLSPYENPCSGLVKP